MTATTSPELAEPDDFSPPPTMGPVQTRRQRRLAQVRANWPVWLVAGVTFVNGLLSLLYVLLVRVHEQPRLFAMPVPFGVHHLTRSLTLAFGFALLYLSVQLFHRRRAAWWLGLAVSLAAALAHIGRGHLAATALGPLAIVALLLIFRRRYTVHSDPRSIAQGLGLMLASLAVALLYGVLGFWLMDQKDFGLVFGVRDAIVYTLRQFALMGNANLVPQTRQAAWFLVSLQIIGVLALAFAIYSLFRPVVFRLASLPRQRAQVKALLERYGGSGVDYFKLLPDKSYFFSADQQNCIAYRTVWGVALGLGDPAGPKEGVPALLAGYLAFCGDNGWAVAFHQTWADLTPVYRAAGLDVLKIGEEAVVELAQFPTTLAGSKHMRKTRSRFVRDGFTFTWYDPPHASALLDEAQEVSDQWLQLPGHRERSFSLGKFDRDYLNETPIAAIRDPQGQMVAFTNMVPSYRPGEATIDLMRHRLDAPNGSMDFLFTELMLRLQEKGFALFNLGMAPFAGVGETPDAPLQERAAHYLSEQLGRFVGYKGIHEYKAKFGPTWEDRYFVYQGGPMGLVKAALALTRATEGEAP